MQIICPSYYYRSKIFLPPLACGSTSLVKG
nr:MAG TPA: hypothetical protein [Caudoviricetes sp.]